MQVKKVCELQELKCLLNGHKFNYNMTCHGEICTQCFKVVRTFPSDWPSENEPHEGETYIETIDSIIIYHTKSFLTRYDYIRVVFNYNHAQTLKNGNVIHAGPRRGQLSVTALAWPYGKGLIMLKELMRTVSYVIIKNTSYEWSKMFPNKLFTYVKGVNLKCE